MRRLTIVVSLAILLITGTLLAGSNPVWIPLVPGSEGQEPAVHLISNQPDEVILEFEFAGFSVNSRETDRGVFTMLDLPGCGRVVTPGRASLPIFRRAVEIPQGALPRIEVLEIETASYDLHEMGYETRVYPAQEPVEKIPGAREQARFVMSEEFYASSTSYPAHTARIENVGQMRGHRFAMVEVAPVRYLPARGAIDVTHRIRLKITTPHADLAATRSTIDRYASPSFEAAASGALLNYQAPAKAVPDWPVGYLIITDPDFYDKMQPLADWKNAKGYETTVTSTADIPGGVTTTAIKKYIKDAWQDWTVPPSYVLLVGDVADIPNWTGTETDNPPTDLYYATMTDPDYIPDLGIGRFSVVTPEQASALVEKTVEYEKQLFSGTSWIKKAVFMSSTHNYAITEGTHNYVISNYLDPAGYASEKLYTYTYSATTQQVRDAFNDGRALGIFSGHGATTYWDDGPHFDGSDVAGLTNLDMYPFVQSYACLTGEYDYGECFAETWTRQVDKAALGFWSSSVTSYWDEDDVLEKGVFKGLFEDGLTWISGMTDQGKWYTYEHYSGGGSVKRYYEMYNLMGDPSLQVWTDIPVTMTVSHTGVCPLGAGTYSVHVEDASGALTDALVCLNMPGEVYENGYTDASGDITLTLDPAPAQVGEMYLTVTGHNHTPITDTVQVVVPAFVTIDPDTIQVETPAAVTVTVTDTLYVPIENIVVTIEGWGIQPALTDTTDATGTAVITVDAPYGEVLSVVGRKIGDAYDNFTEPLVVSGALALPDPEVAARVDAVGLTGALTPYYEGTIVGRTSHTGIDMFAVGSGIDEFVSSPHDSAVINATPTSLGSVTVTLAYPGYDIYMAQVSVIETYGVLAGTVTADASGDSLAGALVSAYVAGSDTSTVAPVFEVTTDGVGTYASPESILVGPHDIYAVKFGYLDFSGSTMVMLGANTYDFVMASAPSGVISGAVTEDGTEKPLTATIEVYRSDDLSLFTQTSSDSSSAGAYITDPVPYFTYLVRVSAYHYITQNIYVTVDEATETADFKLIPTIGNLLVVDDRGARATPDTKYGPRGEVIIFDESLDPEAVRTKSADIIAQDLTDLGYDVTTETSAATDPGTWTDYDIVVWSSGDNLSPVSQSSYRSSLNQYVAGGGRLLMEGGEIGYDAASFPGYPNFADTTLHVSSWNHDPSGDLTLNLPAHPVATVPNILPATMAMTYAGYGDQDALTPHTGVQMVYDWSSYGGQGGVLVYDDTPDPQAAQIVFYSFDYVNVTDSTARVDLLQNTIEHLMATESTPEGSVSGSVELSGEATYEGVVVRAVPGDFADTTDASGSYSIGGLYDATYALTASKAGFGDSTVTIEISGGSALENVNFKLFPVFEYMDSTVVSIPDNDSTGIKAYIDIDADAELASVDCYVDITHTFRGDLIIDLTSPEGTTVRLHDRTGGSDNDINTWYDSETEPDGPGSMADFVGEWAAGTWEIWIRDLASSNTGTLNAWGLRIGFPASTAEVEVTEPATPAQTFLARTWPNPFTSMTSLQFGLARSAEVRLAVYNVLGQEVALLAEGSHPAGFYELTWDGTGTDGRSVASGIYFCRLRTDDFITTQRMVLMK